jgi:putative pyoverdin transport system ATP-binding/permease protein
VLTDGITGSAVAYPFGLVFIGLCLAQLVTRSFTQLIVLRLTHDAVRDMRLRISARILASPLRKLEEIGNAKLLVVLSKDIDNFANSLQLAPQVFAAGVIVLCSMAYLGWLSWIWFIMFGAALVICFTAFRLAQRFPTRQIRIVREQLDTVYRLFRDLLEGTKELQLNRPRGQHFVSHVIAPEVQAYRRSVIRGFSVSIWIVNIGDIMFYAVLGLLLFAVPGWLGMPMPVDLRVKIGLTLMYLIGPIGAISNAMPAFGQASVALGKIQKLEADLDQGAPPPLVGDPFGEPGGGRALLELRNVVYEYTAQSDATAFRLGPLNLHIPRGQISFIVGSNGSGKSTLAKVLSSLYAPESGTICMNGVPVTPANVDHYRRRFSAVFSDFHLFEQLMGVGGVHANDIAADYLRKLRIENKVSLKDGHFSTVDLSSGQKKRLALIVSYLEDRPIYLFDEWASDQDPVFKRFFYAELLPELRARGKTVIAISHDDAYFHHADHVFHIDETVIDQGAANRDDERLAVCK